MPSRALVVNQLLTAWVTWVHMGSNPADALVCPGCSQRLSDVPAFEVMVSKIMRRFAAGPASQRDDQHQSPPFSQQLLGVLFSE